MITQFGTDLGWTVTDSQSSEIFTTEALSQMDVVVWLNTSGDGLLTTSEELAFEAFIQNGGGFVGIHAATDTYRGGSWPWYNDLVGGIVQVSPNHTVNNTNATMDVVGVHPAVNHLLDTWNKNEEYYYWERNGGYLYSGNINLLSVQSTGSNSYDISRPITWYKNFDGGRSFYTALGHNSVDYQSDTNFKTMIREAIIWSGGEGEVGMFGSQLAKESSEAKKGSLLVYPNPVKEEFSIQMEGIPDTGISEVSLYGLDGNLVKRTTISSSDTKINIGDLPSGYYMISLVGMNLNEQRLIFVE
jgi:type 1 glutamine amidotransferase